jgi:hypothetical protein
MMDACVGGGPARQGAALHRHYRQSLAKQIKKSTDRILDNDDVPRLVSRSS